MRRVVGQCSFLCRFHIMRRPGRRPTTTKEAFRCHETWQMRESNEQKEKDMLRIVIATRIIVLQSEQCTCQREAAMKPAQSDVLFFVRGDTTASPGKVVRIRFFWMSTKQSKSKYQYGGCFGSTGVLLDRRLTQPKSVNEGAFLFWSWKGVVSTNTNASALGNETQNREWRTTLPEQNTSNHIVAY